MRRLLFLLLVSFTLVGCNKRDEPIVPDDPSGEEEIKIKDYEEKLFLAEVFPFYYYWNEYLPDSVEVVNNDIYSFFNSCLYYKDRWSWMMNRAQWDSDRSGVYLSYGGKYSQAIEYYQDYDVKIYYVYPNSPFAKQGVTRGWTLTHLGGVDVRTLIIAGKFDSESQKSPQSFTFRDLSGAERRFTVSAEQFQTQTVLRENIFTSNDYEGLPGKVGYMNYISFKSTFLDDISSAMERFYDEGITDLILDLRYNGGGDSEASTLLGEYIIPASADGKILQKLQHNKIQSLLGKDVSIFLERKEKALSLSRLFFITGHGTASASEVIINGMKALLGDENIHMVGDTTYGKPNGMYAFACPQGTQDDYYANARYIFLPICFYNCNCDGEFIPDDGFVPTHYRPDDLYHDWGVEEDLIASCLHYIVNGTFPNLPTLSSKSGAPTKASGEDIRLQMEYDLPNYGKFIVPGNGALD